MTHSDVDPSLLESIQNMTTDELVAMQAECEASGAAEQLRKMMVCVRHLADVRTSSPPSAP